MFFFEPHHGHASCPLVSSNKVNQFSKIIISFKPNNTEFPKKLWVASNNSSAKILNCANVTFEWLII